MGDILGKKESQTSQEVRRSSMSIRWLRFVSFLLLLTSTSARWNSHLNPKEATQEIKERKIEIAEEKRDIFERRQEKHEKRMHQFEEVLQLRKGPQSTQKNHKGTNENMKSKSKSKKQKYKEWNDEKPVVVPDGVAELVDRGANRLDEAPLAQVAALDAPSVSPPSDPSLPLKDSKPAESNYVNNMEVVDSSKFTFNEPDMTPTDDSAELNHPIAASSDLALPPLQQNSKFTAGSQGTGDPEQGTGMLGPSAFSHFFVIFLSIFATAAGYVLLSLSSVPIFSSL